jgi:hypothetical protein
MNNPLEIVGYLVKSGASREVIALELDGQCPARDYLLDLANHNAKGWQILSSQIRLSADVPRLQTRDTFKLLDPSRQLYEFRTRSGLRLYCFLNDDQLILLTNGGKKNTTKEQDRDIRKSQAFCDEFRSRVASGAFLTIIEP